MNSVCLQPRFCSIPVLACFGQSGRSFSRPAGRVQSTSIEDKAPSFPLARDALIDLSIKRIQSVVGYAALDGSAGAEGGGVPFASIIADRLHLPLVIARKQSAGLGPGAQTDGVVEPGRQLLLVDDVTTDGRTKALMCEALRKAEATVHFAFVVFQYGIFDAAMRQQDLGVQLLSLLT